MDVNGFLRFVRFLVPNIYFNFHYLPFKQAVKFPIFLYKPHLLKMKGNVKVENDNIRPGMIRLGYPTVSIYPQNGFIYENHGGTIIFHGVTNIGNSSAISVGKTGHIEFGNNYRATTSLKLVSYCGVYFGENVRCGWETTIMDTDFHKLAILSGGFTKGYGQIHIGSNNWFGNGCLVLKKTKTPDFCIFSARSVVSGLIDVPSYSVVGGNPLKIKSSGVWRNVDDDKIIYPTS